MSKAKRSEESVSTDLLDGWKITPSINREYDSRFIPIEEDPEGRNALDLARETFELLWDGADSLETLNITVSMERVKIHKRDYSPEDI